MRSSDETSWRITSIGKSGTRSSGPTGCPVPGWSTGAGGSGRSAATLYHASGSLLSSSVYFTVSSTTAPSGRSAGDYDRSQLVADRDEIVVLHRVLAEALLQLDRLPRMVERDVRTTGPRVRAGEVVVRPCVIGRLGQMPLEHLDRLVPLLVRPELERLGGPLPHRRRKRFARLRADDEDRRAFLAHRASLHRRVGDVHERSGRAVDLFAVHRERRASGQHDVELLVGLTARLLVLADDLAAVLGRRPRVDAERRDPERPPDRVPPGLARDRRGRQLLECRYAVPLAHVASRSRSSTTGSIASSPSTRSSRFSTPAHAARLGCPARASRSASSARSASSTGIQSCRGVVPKSRSWSRWIRRSSTRGSGWSSTRRSTSVSERLA